jgi:hypothetical protein
MEAREHPKYHDGVSPYAERYRIDRFLALCTAVALLPQLWMLRREHGIVRLALTLSVIILFALPLLSAARRQVALQIDQRGILLNGGYRTRWGVPGPRLAVPWEDVAEIVLYRGDTGRCIGVRRQPHAPRLAGRPGRPVRNCPMAGVTIGTSRQLTFWDLDREKLRAAVARFAPAVPIADLWDKDHASS